MSLVLIVDSETQLRCGASWCLGFADQCDLPIRVIVAGKDRKALVRRAEKSFVGDSDSEDDVEVDSNSESELKGAAQSGNRPDVKVISADSDTESLLAACKSAGCSVLVLIEDDGEHSDQAAIFESSPTLTVWMRPYRGAPTQSRQIVEVARGSKPVGTVVTEKLMGLIPGSLLNDQKVSEIGDVGDFVKATAEQVELESFSEDTVLLVGVSSRHKSDPLYRLGRHLMQQSPALSVMMVHTGHSVSKHASGRLDEWVRRVALPMQREQRVQLVSELEIGAKLDWEYVGLISAAAMLAAFGLVQNSAAVIIGAMLIAPLMTPILSAGLALAHGNKPLFYSAVRTVIVGFLGALLTSVAFGVLVRFTLGTGVTEEMWARCNPTWLDFCVGFVGGVAASYARTRSHLSSALAGAAIAAALVPPISTAGLQIALGHYVTEPEGRPIIGPILLVLVNVLSIMAGSAIVLWLGGIRSEHRHGASSRWGPRMTALIWMAVLAFLVGLIQWS